MLHNKPEDWCLYFFTMFQTPVTGDSCSVSVKTATQGDVECGMFWSGTDELCDCGKAGWRADTWEKAGCSEWQKKS